MDDSNSQRWPLAFNQLRRVVFEERSRRAGRAIQPFNVCAAFEFAGSMEVGRLRAALAAMVARQAVFRAGFVRERARDGERDTVMRQVVRAHVELPLREVDLRAGAEKCLAQRLEAVIDEECNTVFGLSAMPLARALLARVADRRHFLVVVCHHLISDRWSIRVLEREIARGYRGTAEPGLAAYDYGAFAREQREYLAGPEGGEALEYWREQWASLDNAQIDVRDLPWGWRNEDAGGGRAGWARLSLSQGVSAEVRRGARRQGATVYMLALAALGIVLHRLTGKNMVGIWCNFRNRWGREQEGLVGWFVNSHLIGVRCEADMTGWEVVAGARASLLEAWDRQRMPLGALWWLVGESRERGLRVALDIEQTERRERVVSDTLSVRRTAVPGVRRWFVDLQINVQSVGGCLDLVAIHGGGVFPEGAMRSLIEELRKVLVGLAVAPAQQVG